MRFSYKDILLIILSLLLFVITSGAIAGFCDEVFPFLAVQYMPIVKIALFICLLIFLAGKFLILLRIIAPYKEGEYKIDNSKFMIVWKYHQFIYNWMIDPIIHMLPALLRSVLYAHFGARIGKNVIITGKLVEPSLIEIGGGSFIGMDSCLVAHVIESGGIFLKKINLGKNVTVGICAIIMPGVTIGNNSIIAANSVVSKNTHIPANEIWGGIPAKKIKDK